MNKHRTTYGRHWWRLSCLFGLM